MVSFDSVQLTERAALSGADLRSSGSSTNVAGLIIPIKSSHDAVA
jgi:hypothetical protein